MAYWIFTKAILEGNPIRVFNNGEMWRHFIYIDDVVNAIIAVLDKPPSAETPSRIHHVGNKQSAILGDSIDILEDMLGAKNKSPIWPMQ
jgi:UDP-glucuronate 4-epimerase